ncbi:MAG: AhpC/TSA family protein, partial [Cytophagales bacterium]|nr:AhpC/TSA family protein [Cytophagales bacterium]
MKKIAFFSVCWLLVLSCTNRAASEAATQAQAPKDGFVLTGKVKYPMGKAKVQLWKIKDNALQPVDSVALDKNNTFTFKGKVAEPDFYVLNFYNTQKVLVIVENAVLTVDVDGNSPTGAVTMKGTPALEDMQKLNNWLADTQKQMGGLQKEMQAAALDKSQSGRQKVEQKLAAIRTENTKKFKDLVAGMKPSLAVWYALNNGVLNPEEEYKFLQPLVADLKKAMPTSRYAPEFDNYAAQLAEFGNALQVGQNAPEISLNTPEGKTLKLSSLRGKYVLIDFWASWCGPCRMENPNVVRMYNKFKTKNFEIYGVSLDRNREDWLKAIEKDQLSWLHVSDLKFWNSEGAKTYGVRGIPAT